jgi:large exoprotein involved in heme utilization and adhesion
VSNFQSKEGQPPGTGIPGNILLNVADLRLNQQGDITSNANAATGGNITINSDTLVALENSDITANALEGPGGRVIINATGIFGTEFREKQTPESDITATSNLGHQFNGVVELNTPDVDTSSGLVTLPENVVDVESLVAKDTCGADNRSAFVVTGKGGLPANPYDLLRDSSLLVDWAKPNPEISNTSVENSQKSQNQSNHSPNPVSLSQATTWRINPDGKIALIQGESVTLGYPSPSSCR